MQARSWLTRPMRERQGREQCLQGNVMSDVVVEAARAFILYLLSWSNFFLSASNWAAAWTVLSRLCNIIPNNIFFHTQVKTTSKNNRASKTVPAKMKVPAKSAATIKNKPTETVAAKRAREDDPITVEVSASVSS